MSTTNSKLLINFIIDNSASMKGEQIDKLKAALTNFSTKIANNNLNDKIDFAITIFKGFESTQFKNFNQIISSYDNLYAGGIPFTGNALANGLDNLTKQVELANKNSEKIYKPWTILLLNGENYGDVLDAANKLVDLIKTGKTSYFPFALSRNDFDISLSPLKKLKPFTTIKNAMYEELFNWVYDLAYKRITTPPEQSFSIDPKSFEGWTTK